MIPDADTEAGDSRMDSAAPVSKLSNSIPCKTTPEHSSQGLSLLLYEGLVGSVCLIYIGFADDLPGRVHVQHGDAAVYDFHAQISQDIGDRSAAALVYFAEFGCLPDNALSVEQVPEICDVLRVCVIEPLFPREPVYLLNTGPLPRYAAFFFSITSG